MKVYILSVLTTIVYVILMYFIIIFNYNIEIYDKYIEIEYPYSEPLVNPITLTSLIIILPSIMYIAIMIQILNKRSEIK